MTCTVISLMMYEGRRRTLILGAEQSARKEGAMILVLLLVAALLTMVLGSIAIAVTEHKEDDA
jgi:hypothetical protein